MRYQLRKPQSWENMEKPHNREYRKLYQIPEWDRPLEEELDLEPARVMFADSICSDDVNSIQYPAPSEKFSVLAKVKTPAVAARPEPGLKSSRRVGFNPGI